MGWSAFGIRVLKNADIGLESDVLIVKGKRGSFHFDPDQKTGTNAKDVAKSKSQAAAQAREQIEYSSFDTRTVRKAHAWSYGRTARESWVPPALFNRTQYTTLVEERRWWLSRTDSRNTVFIVSANLGTLPLVRNLLCSIINNAPQTMDHLVIWALDEEIAFELLKLRERLLYGDFIDTEGRNETRLRKRWRTPMGIYFDQKMTTTPKYTTGASDLVTYFGITELRNYFFVHVLDAIGVNILFTDADIFFLADPFEDLKLPFGVSDFQNRTRKPHKKTDETTSFYRDFPDLIYSTDARKPYHYLDDPYEGQPRVPHICGGFFFARSNPRTIRVFRTIRDVKMNDQWGMDYLLNQVPLVLVDPLPAGIKFRKQHTNLDSLSTQYNEPWRKLFTWRNPLRVRILSQAAYANSMSSWAKVGTRGPDYEKLVKELHERGEKPVSYHPNYWIQPKRNDDLWVFTDNKTWILEQVGMWKIRDGRCYI
ncbi:hypothetical protein HDU97_005219 [Phlyctochytrium planicorne]|nr:hypothetical protein HDU97_005219 [Phlyctochytrium planicorne]